MVIKECLRAHAYLSLYNVATDLVIANRIIPEQVNDPFFAHWKETQQQSRQEIKENFHSLLIKEVPLYTEELCGLMETDYLRIQFAAETFIPEAA